MIFNVHVFTYFRTVAGLLYGAAIGDALGLATCCMTADEVHFHYNRDSLDYSDIVQDELRVRWKQGDWTSNFDMMVRYFCVTFLLLLYLFRLTF